MTQPIRQRGEEKNKIAWLSSLAGQGLIPEANYPGVTRQKKTESADTDVISFVETDEILRWKEIRRHLRRMRKTGGGLPRREYFYDLFSHRKALTIYWRIPISEFVPEALEAHILRHMTTPPQGFIPDSLGWIKSAIRELTHTIKYLTILEQKKKEKRSATDIFHCWASRQATRFPSPLQYIPLHELSKENMVWIYPDKDCGTCRRCLELNLDLFKDDYDPIQIPRGTPDYLTSSPTWSYRYGKPPKNPMQHALGVFCGDHEPFIRPSQIPLFRPDSKGKMVQLRYKGAFHEAPSHVTHKTLYFTHSKETPRKFGRIDFEDAKVWEKVRTLEGSKLRAWLLYRKLTSKKRPRRGTLARHANVPTAKIGWLERAKAQVT